MRSVTLAVLAWTIGAVAPAAQGQLAVAVKVLADDGTKPLVVIKEGRLATVPDADDSSPVSWSGDGRWLVLGKQSNDGKWSLRLVDLSSADMTPIKLEGAWSRPSWAPDGRRFCAAVAGRGIVEVDVSGSEPRQETIVPTGECPTWCPNGGRIAFVGGPKERGLWVVGTDGAKARNPAPGMEAASAAWSPDGRTLCIVAKDAKGKGQRIGLVPASGKGARWLRGVDSSYTAWSPTGNGILCRTGGRWSVLEPKTGSVQGLGLDDAGSPPDWLGSARVLGTEKGRLVEVDRKTGRSSAFEPGSLLPVGKALALAVCRGLVLDGRIDTPFSAFPQPQKGQVRLQGTVESVELEGDAVLLNVWSVGTPDGMELNMAQPVRQWVSVRRGAKRVSSAEPKDLETTDFLQDGEVALLAQGGRAGVPDVLPVTLALIPELLAESGGADAALSRPPRTLEYDGVCMDRVVVPLLFPVEGQVRWSDTFLADRDGGSRRHHGQDLLAPKMRPLLAAFDGVVSLNTSPSGHNTITLRGDDGWTVVYMHVNNDTPGTDDGRGGPRYAFAPGLKSGDRVVRGQLVGFVGDSGNAESTVPHCHFELHDDMGGGVLNAAPSLEEAEHASVPIVVDPLPGLRPDPGEQRWDGVVTEVDVDRGVVVLDLVSVDPGPGLAACAAPRRAYVKLAPKGTVTLRSEEKEARSWADLRAGLFVTALGRIPEAGGAMEARSVRIGLSMAR